MNTTKCKLKCMICMEHFNETKKWNGKLNCGHDMCYECLKIYTKSGKKEDELKLFPKCPVCREYISDKILNSIKVSKLLFFRTTRLKKLEQLRKHVPKMDNNIYHICKKCNKCFNRPKNIANLDNKYKFYCNSCTYKKFSIVPCYICVGYNKCNNNKSKEIICNKCRTSFCTNCNTFYTNYHKCGYEHFCNKCYTHYNYEEEKHYIYCTLCKITGCKKRHNIVKCELCSKNICVYSKNKKLCNDNLCTNCYVNEFMKKMVCQTKPKKLPQLKIKPKKSSKIPIKYCTYCTTYHKTKDGYLKKCEHCNITICSLHKHHTTMKCNVCNIEYKCNDKHFHKTCAICKELKCSRKKHKCKYNNEYIIYENNKYAGLYRNNGVPIKIEKKI